MTNTERLAQWHQAIAEAACLTQTVRVAHEETATELRRLEAKNERTTYMLRNLLARIHRDGGDYTSEHGLEKSVAEADTQVVKWLGMCNEIDTTTKETP